MENKEISMLQKFNNKTFLYYDGLCSMFCSSNKYKGIVQIYEEFEKDTNVVIDGVITEINPIGYYNEIKFKTFDNPFEIQKSLEKSYVAHKMIVGLRSHGLPTSQESYIKIGRTSYSNNESGGYDFTIEYTPYKIDEDLESDLFKLLKENTNEEFGSYHLQYNDHKFDLYSCEDSKRVQRYYAPLNEDLKEFNEETKDVDWSKPIYRLYWYNNGPNSCYCIVRNTISEIVEEVKSIIKEGCK